MKDLYAEIKEFGKVRTDEPFFKHNKIGIGGTVKYYIFIDNPENMVALLNFLDRRGGDYFVFGKGHNILVGSMGFEGIAIEFDADEVKVEDGKVVAEAGADAEKVAQFAMRNQFSGFEWGVGTFGSIAGAIYHDIVLDTHAIEEVIHSLRVYQNGEDIELTGIEVDNISELAQKKDVVILEVTLNLTKGEVSVEDNLQYVQLKDENYPTMQPCIGPIFKSIPAKKVKESQITNIQLDVDPKGRIMPDKLIRPELIEESKVGPLTLFEKNNNFLIRTAEGGSPEQILQLIENIEQSLYDNFGVSLDRRIGMVGGFNN